MGCTSSLATAVDANSVERALEIEPGRPPSPPTRHRPPPAAPSSGRHARSPRRNSIPTQAEIEARNLHHSFDDGSTSDDHTHARSEAQAKEKDLDNAPPTPPLSPLPSPLARPQRSILKRRVVPPATNEAAAPPPDEPSRSFRVTFAATNEYASAPGSCFSSKASSAAPTPTSLMAFDDEPHAGLHRHDTPMPATPAPPELTPEPLTPPPPGSITPETDSSSPALTPDVPSSNALTPDVPSSDALTPDAPASLEGTGAPQTNDVPPADDALAATPQAVVPPPATPASGFEAPHDLAGFTNAEEYEAALLKHARTQSGAANPGDYSEAVGGSQAEYEQEKDFENVMTNKEGQQDAGRHAHHTLALPRWGLTLHAWLARLPMKAHAGFGNLGPFALRLVDEAERSTGRWLRTLNQQGLCFLYVHTVTHEIRGTKPDDYVDDDDGLAGAPSVAEANQHLLPSPLPTWVMTHHDWRPLLRFAKAILQQVIVMLVPAPGDYEALSNDLLEAGHVVINTRPLALPFARTRIKVPDALDTARRQLCAALRDGQTVVLDLHDTCPAFRDKIWSNNKFCNQLPPQLLDARDREFYHSVFDRAKGDGPPSMHEGFRAVVLAQMSEQQARRELQAEVPTTELAYVTLAAQPLQPLCYPTHRDVEVLSGLVPLSDATLLEKQQRKVRRTLALALRHGKLLVIEAGQDPGWTLTDLASWCNLPIAFFLGAMEPQEAAEQLFEAEDREHGMAVVRAGFGLIFSTNHATSHGEAVVQLALTVPWTALAGCVALQAAESDA
ncbi:uncharacterized protein MONBRDRAFT_7029 [Monosiga brevicollis MX1]|uniref:Uncharacterized protein n=1 Tax=Monosiga brevicollis TaxID=81824 RepID=A9UVP5_MONBE|nr:uncharacterized protein MONBRDRAFT_7029 [Monosiga brevicollis MX1]EDQ90621.1 predicted protein [Monosiga brevicollis MX1]|eukprot:XP_001744672.1 hypothetical protein [Monosiga brevicollis MX1]